MPRGGPRRSVADGPLGRGRLRPVGATGFASLLSSSDTDTLTGCIHYSLVKISIGNSTSSREERRVKMRDWFQDIIYCFDAIRTAICGCVGLISGFFRINETGTPPGLFLVSSSFSHVRLIFSLL